MSKKISAFTELATNPATTDLFLLELASTGAYRKIKYTNIVPVGSLVQSIANTTSAVSTGTTVIPYDDTIPQSTEGDQVLSQAITPQSATNIIEIAVVVYASISTQQHLIAAIFQDATANALTAVAHHTAATNGGAVITMITRVVAGTTASTTFKVRVGTEGAGTTTINGASAARKFGAIGKSTITLREYKA